MNILTNKQEHERALDRLDELMDLASKVGTEEALGLEALAALIETYEKQQGFFKIAREITALEFIKFRMEQNGLTAKDMQAYLGSPSKVSEVLNGKHPLSLTMMRKLHKGLNIPADILLGV